MHGNISKGLPDVRYITDSRWNYPDWFFATARWQPGGPTWYDADYRMRARFYMNAPIIAIFLVLVVLVFLYLLILPIIKYRINSTIATLQALGVGLTICLCMVVPKWIVGSSALNTNLNHYAPTDIYEVEIGVHVGLVSLNVTMDHLHTVHAPVLQFEEHAFWFNEIVNIYHPDNLDRSMNYYLGEGIPTPLLTTLSFLTASSLGFEWPHHISEAGFHCYIIMLGALIVWFISLLLMCFIPRYSSFAYIAIGFLMVINTIVYFYWTRIDIIFPVIVVNDTFIELYHGPCFWSCLGVGGWCIIYGFTLIIMDIVHPDKFLTIFDVEYDEKRTLARAYRLNKFEEDKNLRYKNPMSIRMAFPDMDQL